MVLSLVLASMGCGRASPPGVRTELTAPDQGARSLELHVEWTIDVESRARLDAIVAALSAKAAYVERADVDGDGARLVLRVRPAEIAGTRALAAEQGAIAREVRSAKDVTDAIADVDARVHAAKAEETRLLAVLEKQAGTLADVLAVEKALSGVRERIERLEAEQRVARGRVDLATIDVRVALHEDANVSHQLASAARDGVHFARTAAIGVASMTLRVAPTLSPMALALVLLLRALRRRVTSGARGPTTSG